MTHGTLLANGITFTSECVRLNLTGVSEQESLVFPGVYGNNINWVLGHILSSRNLMKQELGFMLDNVDSKIDSLYKQGSSPRQNHTHETLRFIQHRLQGQQHIVTDSLKSLGNENEICTMSLFRLIIHEAYHAGQIAALRWSIGKPGVIN